MLDEFQDIALIDEAEALFRNGLEHIDSRIPVVISGSKQHLLNRIFARPKAPFFNWGTHVHFEAINYHEYWQYMDERFKQEGYRISYENAVYLQDKMSRMPGAVNRLCFALLFHDIPKGAITSEDNDETRKRDRCLQGGGRLHPGGPPVEAAYFKIQTLDGFSRLIPDGFKRLYPD